jgi:hypothetical protein
VNSDLPEEEDLDVVTPIDLEEIHGEGEARLAMWTEIRKLIPSPATQCEVLIDPEQAPTPFDQNLLELLKDGISVGECALELRCMDFPLHARLFDLTERKLIQPLTEDAERLSRAAAWPPDEGGIVFDMEFDIDKAVAEEESRLTEGLPDSTALPPDESLVEESVAAENLEDKVQEAEIQVADDAGVKAEADAQATEAGPGDAGDRAVDAVADALSAAFANAVPGAEPAETNVAPSPPAAAETPATPPAEPAPEKAAAAVAPWAQVGTPMGSLPGAPAEKTPLIPPAATSAPPEPTAPPAAQPPSGNHPLAKLRESLAGRDWNKALLISQRVLELDPANAEAMAARRVAQAQIRRNEDVLPALKVDLRSVPVLTRPKHEIPKTQLTSKERYLLSRIDGKRSLKQIVAVSPIKEAELIRIVNAFANGKILELKKP